MVLVSCRSMVTLLCLDEESQKMTVKTRNPEKITVKTSQTQQSTSFLGRRETALQWQLGIDSAQARRCTKKMSELELKFALQIAHDKATRKGINCWH